ncbi:hypothetical protein KR009_001540 [Drosophila setifemur]|nr:hypothetical protein KR009_001540 [Drosophila setifemur]
MNFLGIGARVVKLKIGPGTGTYTQSRSKTCCPLETKEPPLCCPKKRFRNLKRTLFFSTLTFGAGVYTGLYLSQNYEVPRVDDPQKLIQKMNDKVKELMDDSKKK